MRGMREETFGPTLPIAAFKTEEEAIQLANDSEFGLTASVWTKDLAKGKRVAERIEAGTVCVNEVLYTHGIGQTPWGGFKNSRLRQNARAARLNGTRPAAAYSRQPFRHFAERVVASLFARRRQNFSRFRQIFRDRLAVSNHEARAAAFKTN